MADTGERKIGDVDNHHGGVSGDVDDHHGGVGGYVDDQHGEKKTSGDLMATTLWGSNATASKLTKVKLYFNKRNSKKFK